MRSRYRTRRDTLVAAIGGELPGARVPGIAAGLHVTVELPGLLDEDALRDELVRRRIELATLRDYRTPDAPEPPTLMLGYGAPAEPSIRPGVRELAAGLAAIRPPSPGTAAG